MFKYFVCFLLNEIYKEYAIYGKKAKIKIVMTRWKLIKYNGIYCHITKLCHEHKILTFDKVSDPENFKTKVNYFITM